MRSILRLRGREGRRGGGPGPGGGAGGARRVGGGGGLAASMPPPGGPGRPSTLGSGGGFGADAPVVGVLGQPPPLLLLVRPLREPLSAADAVDLHAVCGVEPQRPVAARHPAPSVLDFVWGRLPRALYNRGPGTARLVASRRKPGVGALGNGTSATRRGNPRIRPRRASSPRECWEVPTRWHGRWGVRAAAPSEEAPRPDTLPPPDCRGQAAGHRAARRHSGGAVWQVTGGSSSLPRRAPPLRAAHVAPGCSLAPPLAPHLPPQGLNGAPIPSAPRPSPRTHSRTPPRFLCL